MSVSAERIPENLGALREERNETSDSGLDSHLGVRRKSQGKAVS